MGSSKSVAVVHPDTKVRIALRSLLEPLGCSVATDHSCVDLLEDQSDLRPDLILLDRTLLAAEGFDVLSRLNGKWTDAETVLLPEGLSCASQHPAFATPLLSIIGRFLQMRTTRELLAV